MTMTKVIYMEQASLMEIWKHDADKAKYDDIIERLETLEYFALNVRSCVNATIEELYPLGDALIKEAKIAQHIRECSEGTSQITHRLAALRDNTKYLQIKEHI